MNPLSGKKGLILFTLALISLFGLILLYSDQGLVKLKGLEAEKRRLIDENEALREENRRLRKKIESIKSDPLAIEEEARKKLGVVRPDETIYRLGNEPENGEPKIENGVDDSP